VGMAQRRILEMSVLQVLLGRRDQATNGRIVQSSMGLTTTAAHLREFASMTEDLQLEITMNSTINGSQSIIGWGKASVHD
jgi:hypothetical protein